MSAWEIFQVVLPILQSVLLAALALFTSNLSDRVSHSIQEKQLDLSNIEAMKDLMLKVQSAEAATDAEEAEAAAVTLAAFGSRAVPPLINVIQVASESGKFDRIPAAEKGLRAIGWDNPGMVCPQLTKVIQNRSALFNWWTHLSAIRTLGDLQCVDALPALGTYRAAIGDGPPAESLRRFETMVSALPAPSLNGLAQIRAKLSQTIQTLQRPEEFVQ